MKNSELLQMICDKLNKAGYKTTDSTDILSVKEMPFSLDCSAIKELDWLPEENLKKIALFDCSKCTSFSDLYQAWGRQGLFKSKPYVVRENEDDNPTMVLRHNRFLHMFRGYYFQISETVNGIGACSTSVYGVRNLLYSGSFNNAKWEKSKLYFMILYANMIDVGFQNDNFMNTFYEDRDFIDDFFRKSMRYWNRNLHYGHKDIAEQLSYDSVSLLAMKYNEPVYEINLKHGCVCRFQITDDKVMVEYSASTDSVSSTRVVTLNIPKPTDGITNSDGSEIGEDLREELTDEFEDFFPDSNEYKRMLLLMMLKFVGINTNYMSTYAIRKIGFIRPSVDKNNVIKFETCNDFVD